MCSCVCEKTTVTIDAKHEKGASVSFDNLSIQCFLKCGHLKNTLQLSRLTRIIVKHHTATARGQSKLWNNRLRNRTMWLDCIPVEKKYACRTRKLFPFYSLLFIQSFIVAKGGCCQEKITCPLSTMHSVFLWYDNVRSINCWFCPLFSYDSETSLWKQGWIRYITPDLAVSIHPL